MTTSAMSAILLLLSIFINTSRGGEETMGGASNGASNDIPGSPLSAICLNCTNCPYPCYTNIPPPASPPPSPPAPLLGYPSYGSPPPPEVHPPPPEVHPPPPAPVSGYPSYGPPPPKPPSGGCVGDCPQPPPSCQNAPPSPFGFGYQPPPYSPYYYGAAATPSPSCLLLASLLVSIISPFLFMHVGLF